MSAIDPLVGRRPLVRADVQTPTVLVDEDLVATVILEVTNLDTVITSHDVTVLGVDDAWVTVSPPVVDLFPDERATVEVTLRLPPDHPAGRRTIGLRVGTTDDPLASPVVVDAVFELAAQVGMAMATEPGTLEMAGSGSFLLHIYNTGNTALEPALLAQDAERLVTVVFDPSHPVVQPGDQAVVRALATGPRPWIGLPVVRVLEVTATEGEVVAVSAVALVQTPRIGRRLISFLGLLLVVSLFALVISLSFGRVADLNARNEALVAQGLGLDQPVGARIGPSSFGGRIASSTGGGINGASIELYDENDALRPVQTTVTDETGAYVLPAVPAGTYLLRTAAAGFGQLWFPGVVDVADAETIEIEGGADAEGFDIVLAGQPGSVVGRVVGDDVADAIVTVELPPAAITGSDLVAAPAVVQTLAIDATGQFVFAGLTTPASYQLRIVKPGYAEELRTITLRAGEDREDVEILIGRGIGVITGSVLDTAGTPIGGVDITATDGSTNAGTRSLSGAGSPGTFELRDLTAPGTYTLTFTAPGYFPETTTVTLGETGTGTVTVVMTADNGSLAGTAVDAAGAPLGDVTVTVVGADLERTTQTVSVGDVGSWIVDGLPVPGTYTVSFSGPTVVTTAVSVELVAGAGATRTDVNASLIAALATVRGRVTNTDGDPIGGVTITLDGSSAQRQTVSSDDPPGAYVLDGLPADVYTLTFARAGSAVQTRLVDLGPGADLELDDIQLEAQAVVNGIVRRDGVGVPNVGVVVYRSSEYPERTAAFTTTDQNGVFMVDGLDAPETYIIEFQVPAGGQVVASRVVQLRPGESVFLEVDV